MEHLKNAGLSALALLLSACAHASVMDLDANTIQVSANAAPVCGSEGAEKVTTRLAAIETINRGFDRYVILGAQTGTTTEYAGTTPVTANTYSNGTATIFGNTGTYAGTSTTTFNGGTPIILHRHNEALQVRMYKADDPAGANAIDARAKLGPEWQKLAAKGTVATCAE